MDMDLIERVNGHFLESIAAKQETMEQLSPAVAAAAERMVACLMNEGKILACGNGGSAADAQHFAAEMVGRFEKERPGLAALSLATDSSALTAIGNDYDFDMVFSKQVRALGHTNDLLLAISTSGNSANVIEAIYAAHERGMGVIALTGKDGGKIGEILSADDIQLNVPVSRTARIQEVHILLIHALCDAIDYMLLGGE
ncbi:phosphoheptose isomerase [Pseudogulbenkiania sp. NH8B]|nr:phosphoheptose isomerase [Pseudogulbenkiania sp. NH8B]